MDIEKDLESPIGTEPSGDENAIDTIILTKTGETKINLIQSLAVGPHAKNARLDPTAVNDLADPSLHTAGHPIHTEHRVNGNEGFEITTINPLASIGFLHANHPLIASANHLPPQSYDLPKTIQIL
jgi:hypothetical protein